MLLKTIILFIFLAVKSFKKVVLYPLTFGDLIIFTPIPTIISLLDLKKIVSCKIPHNLLLLINRSFGGFIVIFLLIKLLRALFTSLQL